MKPKALRRPDGRIFDLAAYAEQKRECACNGRLFGNRCRHPETLRLHQDAECRPLRCSLCQKANVREDPFHGK